jgi:hypothetical protein
MTPSGLIGPITSEILQLLSRCEKYRALVTLGEQVVDTAENLESLLHPALPSQESGKVPRRA